MVLRCVADTVLAPMNSFVCQWRLSCFRIWGSDVLCMTSKLDCVVAMTFRRKPVSEKAKEISQSGDRRGCGIGMIQDYRGP